MLMLQRLWNDEAGMVVSSELVFVTSIAAIGTIADIVASRPELQGRTLEEMFIALTGDDARAPTA